METYFVPQTCEEGELVYCRGCGFKEKIEKEFASWGIDVLCQKDVLNMYPKIERVIDFLKENNSALLPIELGIKNAWHLKREFNLEPIEPLPIRKLKKEEKGDIRISQLTAPCPLGAIIPYEPPEKVKRAAELGTIYHSFALTDPPLKENEVYLPWFFLDEKNYIPRKEYCEVPLCSKIIISGVELILSGTPDAVFKTKSSIIVVDLKSANAPPFFPYSAHSRQLAGYGLLLEALTGKRAEKGMVIYARKLGGKFSPRVVDISEQSKAREETVRFLNALNLLQHNQLTPQEFYDKKCLSCFLQPYCFA